MRIRLSLAKALHQKKLIATAEFDILEQSFYANDANDADDVDDDQGDSSDNQQTNRKRRRDQSGVRNGLKMAFSRFPIDKGNPCSMRHMKTVLNDYFTKLSVSEAASNDQLPSPNDVAEWALLSFCGLVAANGMDEPKNTESEEYSMESQMVTLLTLENAKSQRFTNAVKSRIRQMLEPPMVDELSNLNILCLVRFFSYLDENIVNMLFTHGLNMCFQCGCGSGFSSFPKLIAAYASIISRRNQSFSSMSFQKDVNSLISALDHKDEEAKQMVKFTSAIFDLSTYLMMEGDRKKKCKIYS